MILSEKLLLTEKFILCEAESKDPLSIACEAAIAELQKAAQEQNKTNNKGNSLRAVKTLRGLVLTANVTLKSSSADIDVKKSTIEDVITQVKQFVNTGYLSSSPELVNRLNDVCNSLNSFITNNFAADSVWAATDTLAELDEICSIILNRADMSLIDNDKIFDMTNAIIVHGKAAQAESEDTTFLSAVKSLSSDIGAAADLDKKIDICKDFNDTWAKKYSPDTTDVKSVTKTTDYDWEADYDTNSGADKRQVWDNFVKTTFGNASEFINGLGPNFRKLCENNGFSQDTNPFLAFILNKALAKSGENTFTIKLHLNANTFYALIDAIRRDYISEKNLLGTASYSSCDVINCPGLYANDQNTVLTIIGLQHDLITGNTYNAIIDEKHSQEALEILDALGLDADSQLTSQRLALANQILYRKNEVMADSAVLRDYRTINKLVIDIFGFQAKYGGKSDSEILRTIERALSKGASSDIEKMIKEYAEFFTAIYRVYTANGSFAPGLKYFTPDTKEYRSLTLTVAESEILKQLVDIAKEASGTASYYNNICNVKLNVSDSDKASFIKVLVKQITRLLKQLAAKK